MEQITQLPNGNLQIKVTGPEVMLWLDDVYLHGVVENYLDQEPDAVKLELHTPQVLEITLCFAYPPDNAGDQEENGVPFV